MGAIVDGIIAGVVAGIFMGVISDIGYHLKVFKSSLVVIDGSFVLRFVKKEMPGLAYYALGIPLHLITSAVFGAIYILMTGLMGLQAVSPLLIAIYFFILWLSMLFIALPVAGQGIAGRKIAQSTWFEQLILHLAFGLGYLKVLEALSL